MSLLFTEEVEKYREFEVQTMMNIINSMLVGNEDITAFQKGQMDAIKKIVRIPESIAQSPEEKVYAKELIGKTRELLAKKIAEKYLFEV
jgi:CHASE3 domain sensor protein